MRNPDTMTCVPQLIERLGKGAYGAAYRAYDKTKEKTVALKIAHSNQLSMQESPDHVFAAFATEARALEKLSGVEHIIGYYGAGTITPFDRELPYIVLEFAPYGTVKDLLPKLNTPSSYLKIASFVEQIAQGLGNAHRRGVFNGDIKWKNCLIGTNHQLLIADWGSARFEGDPEKGILFGTPDSMAPEQFDGDINPKTDLYSLALITYVALVGYDPHQIEVGNLDDPRSIFTGIYIARKTKQMLPLRRNQLESAEMILSNALSANPDKRQESVEEFAALFKQAILSRQGIPERHIFDQGPPMDSYQTEILRQTLTNESAQQYPNLTEKRHLLQDALVYEKNGRYYDALSSYKKLLQTIPNSSEVFLHIGNIYYQLSCKQKKENTSKGKSGFHYLRRALTATNKALQHTSNGTLLKETLLQKGKILSDLGESLFAADSSAITRNIRYQERALEIYQQLLQQGTINTDDVIRRTAFTLERLKMLKNSMQTPDQLTMLYIRSKRVVRRMPEVIQATPRRELSPLPVLA